MLVSHTSGMIESHPSCRGYRVAMFCLSYALRPKKEFSIDCVLWEVHGETEERVDHRSHNNTT